MNISVIIVAAGTGSRFGSDVPKQFCLLGGKAVAQCAIQALQRALEPHCVEFVMAISPAMRPLWQQLWPQSPARLVDGGATRWHSVAAALAAVSPDAQYILVHDAARPLVTPALCHHLIDALDAGTPGAVPAIVPSSSLRHVDADGHSVAVPRAQYREVQTPQAFPAHILRQAYRLPYSPDFTDDASVVEAAGYDITLTLGDPTNIKITHPRDLAIANLLAADFA